MAVEMQERSGFSQEDEVPSGSVIPKQRRVEYRDVDIHMMRPWLNNPENRQGNDEIYRDLVDSLSGEGQLQPVTLVHSSEGPGYVIADGNRRWRAAHTMGWQSLRAAIYPEFNERNILELVVPLNMFQKPWRSKDMLQTAAKYGVDEVVARTPKRFHKLITRMAHELTPDQFGLVAERLGVDSYALAIRTCNYIGWERSMVGQVLVWFANNTNQSGKGPMYPVRVAIRTDFPPERLAQAIEQNTPLW